jgi:hypothetical protein
MILNTYHHKLRPQETAGRFFVHGFAGEQTLPQVARGLVDR